MRAWSQASFRLWGGFSGMDPICYLLCFGFWISFLVLGMSFQVVFLAFNDLWINHGFVDIFFIIFPSWLRWKAIWICFFFSFIVGYLRIYSPVLYEPIVSQSSCKPVDETMKQGFTHFLFLCSVFIKTLFMFSSVLNWMGHENGVTWFGFDDGFPEMENFQHIMDLKSRWVIDGGNDFENDRAEKLVWKGFRRPGWDWFIRLQYACIITRERVIWYLQWRTRSTPQAWLQSMWIYSTTARCVSKKMIWRLISFHLIPISLFCSST